MRSKRGEEPDGGALTVCNGSAKTFGDDPNKQHPRIVTLSEIRHIWRSLAASQSIKLRIEA